MSRNLRTSTRISPGQGATASFNPLTVLRAWRASRVLDDRARCGHTPADQSIAHALLQSARTAGDQPAPSNLSRRVMERIHSSGVTPIPRSPWRQRRDAVQRWVPVLTGCSLAVATAALAVSSAHTWNILLPGGGQAQRIFASRLVAPAAQDISPEASAASQHQALMAVVVNDRGPAPVLVSPVQRPPTTLAALQPHGAAFDAPGAMARPVPPSALWEAIEAPLVEDSRALRGEAIETIELLRSHLARSTPAPAPSVLIGPDRAKDPGAP